MLCRYRHLTVATWVGASVMLVLAANAAGQTPERATRRAGRTRVIMLGTGLPAADPDRFGPAVVVLVDSTPYLFDMGVGVVRQWAAALRANTLRFPRRRSEPRSSPTSTPTTRSATRS